DPAPPRLGVESEDGDFTLVSRPVSLEDLDERGLARAVRAQKAEHLAARDRQVHTRESPRVAVRLADPPGHHSQRPRLRMSLRRPSFNECWLHRDSFPSSWVDGRELEDR